MVIAETALILCLLTIYGGAGIGAVHLPCPSLISQQSLIPLIIQDPSGPAPGIRNRRHDSMMVPPFLRADFREMLSL